LIWGQRERKIFTEKPSGVLKTSEGFLYAQLNNAKKIKLIAFFGVYE